MKKPAEIKSGPAEGHAPIDARFAKDYPTLWEYMTDTRWDDGTPRTPSNITLFVDDGVVKASLADKDLKRSLYTAGETVQEALRALEKALGGSAPDWRKWGANTKRK